MLSLKWQNQVKTSVKIKVKKRNSHGIFKLSKIRANSNRPGFNIAAFAQWNNQEHAIILKTFVKTFYFILQVLNKDVLNKDLPICQPTLGRWYSSVTVKTIHLGDDNSDYKSGANRTIRRKPFKSHLFAGKVDGKWQSNTNLHIGMDQIPVN